jgi:hypothetical protein
LLFRFLSAFSGHGCGETLNTEWVTLNYVNLINHRRKWVVFDDLLPVEFEAHHFDSGELESLSVMEMI